MVTNELSSFGKPQQDARSGAAGALASVPGALWRSAERRGARAWALSAEARGVGGNQEGQARRPKAYRALIGVDDTAPRGDVDA